MNELTLEVQPREATGKNANRRLRSAGKLPAVVYGAGKDAVPIQLDRTMLTNLMRSTEGHNPIFLLKLGDTGKSRHAMIRDIHIDPVTRQVVHVDFLRVLMTEKVRVSVDIELIGVPVGVKTEGGIIDFMTRDVEIECLPGDIPAKLTIDISELHIGQHLEVGDLQVPDGVELHEDEDKVVAAVAHPRIVEEEEEEEEELLIESETAEPELIRKPRDDEEDEERGD